MKRLLLLAMLFAGTATAATIPVSGTVPRLDNSGSCAQPYERVNPYDSDSATVQIRWVGPVLGSDSLRVRKGDHFNYTATVSPGGYVFTLWAVDRGGIGCPVSTSKVIGDMLSPAKIVLDR